MSEAAGAGQFGYRDQVRRSRRLPGTSPRATSRAPGPGTGWFTPTLASTFALALLDQAQAGKRDFAGILFSSARQSSKFRFPAGQAPGIGVVLDLAEFFYGGGTDFETPLDQATELLEAEFGEDGKTRGDIVLITDGACDVSEGWTRAWNDRKHRLGLRLFGISGLSSAAGSPAVMDMERVPFAVSNGHLYPVATGLHLIRDKRR
jgi:hypothetical protein